MSITVKDIAKIAGVSHTTVLKALHGKPRISPELTEKIKRIAAENNYVVNVNARNLATKENKVIGIVVTDISLPLFSELTKAVEDIARANGYNVIVCCSDNDPVKEKAAIQGLQELRVAGMIVTPSYKGEECIRTLEESNIPFILLGHLDHDNESYVSFDDEEATYQATQHLLQNNHTRVACVSQGSINDFPFLAWMNGYRRALSEAGVSYRPELIFESTAHPEAGYRIVQDILALRERPTAILGFSDKNTVGMIKGLKDRQVAIPTDIAIITLFDSEMFNYLDPPISAIRFPVPQLGKLSAEYLFQKIGNKSLELKSVLFQTELIIRKST